MLDALLLGNHNWILPAPITSTPFSCFPSVQKLLLILCSRVTCFADSIFRHSSSPIFQVSLVFVPGTLGFGCRHVSGDGNVRGCFLDTLELRGFFLGLWVHVCSHPFANLVLRHETDSPFLCPFVVVCLQYGEGLRGDFH